MKWPLVVIQANAPVEDDLVYGTLPDCLRAAQTMQQHWEDMNAGGISFGGPNKGTLEMMKQQVRAGTCIPTS